MGILAPPEAANGGEGPPAINHRFHAHPLRRVYLPYGAAVCDGCRLPCSGGVAYICDDCNYVLDKACATAPPTLTYGGHKHALTFTEKPPYLYGFRCNACGMAGEGFCFRCSTCSFDLHVHCAPTSALNPLQGSSDAAGAGTAPGSTSSSSAVRGTGMSGLQTGVAALQGAVAVASVTHHGLQIHRMTTDQSGGVAANTVRDASATDAAPAADLADAEGGGGFLSTILDFFSS